MYTSLWCRVTPDIYTWFFFCKIAMQWVAIIQSWLCSYCAKLYGFIIIQVLSVSSTIGNFWCRSFRNILVGNNFVHVFQFRPWLWSLAHWQRWACADLSLVVTSRQRITAITASPPRWNAPAGLQTCWTFSWLRKNFAGLCVTNNQGGTSRNLCHHLLQDIFTGVVQFFPSAEDEVHSKDF